MVKCLFYLILLGTITVKGQSLKVAQNYLDRSDYCQAVSLYKKTANEAKQANNLKIQVIAQNGLADCYLDLGANYKAISILKKNIDLMNKSATKNFLLLAKTHQLLANCYDKLFLAEDYLTECNTFYSYYKKAAPDKEIYKALYYAYVGRYYNIRFIVDKAFIYTSNALKIYHRNKKENLVDPYIFYNAHLFTMRNRASYIETIRFRDSVSYFINKRYPFDNLKKSRLLISLAAPNLDFVERMKDKPSKELKKNTDIAINYYATSISINEKYSGYYDSNTANAFSLMGLMYFYKKDYTNALKCYDEGIKRITYSIDNSVNFYSNNNLILIGLYNWHSWCLNKIYDTSNDINLLYQIESDLIKMEKTWIRYSKQIIKSKEHYNINIYADCPYLLMVNNYRKLYNYTGQKKYLNKIYEYDEKTRYSSLLENKIKNTDLEDVITEKQIQVAFEDLFLQENAKISSCFPRFNKTNKDFVLLFNSFIKKEHKDLKLLESYFLKLNKMQANLKTSDAVVFYNFTGNHNDEIAYSLVVTTKKIAFINLNQSNKDYSFYDFKSDELISSLYKNDISLFKKQSYSFYKFYFKPIEEVLPKSIRNICIVPNGLVSTISFDFIIDKPSANSNSFKELPYLLYKYNFSYSLSPSVSNLNNHKIKKNSYFSIFSPVFNKGNLAKLNIANYESKKISEEYGANYYKDTKANLAKFTHSLETDNSIALFSHGTSNTKELDEQKGVYLSDGFLSIKDIYKLKSNCNFLLLGACETGIGFNSREGNINLARAFTAIGVKSMILASWKIDEKSSAQIISSFLKYLDGGCTKSEALQKAKLDYLATASPRMANPLYWAGLNITGNNETIKLHQPNYWWWGLILIPILGGRLYYTKRRKTKFLKLF